MLFLFYFLIDLWIVVIYYNMLNDMNNDFNIDKKYLEDFIFLIKI